MTDKYLIPQRLDDPELIGLWTLDEFIAMVAPFVWGILSQHIVIGILSGIRGMVGPCGKQRQAELRHGCCTWLTGIYQQALWGFAPRHPPFFE